MPFDCSSLTSEWTLAQVSPGDRFYVRMFSTHETTQAEAETVCGSQKSTLPRIKTLERLQFFRSRIMACNVTAGFIWLDGKNTYSGDWSWRFSDGTPINMTQGASGFWVTGRPNDGDRPHCLRLWAQQGHLLDDTSCTGLYPTICERN
ncbi:type-2 ice-structuring protein-like isoform X2 [Dreissena polymorpha]|uniref:type-2 ice-structuring protein-like isoform X2 n=1 Tax=Dreissena polymorpha TaxID=45954 RepID=UPI002264A9DB|nr:type-2 ice-structuring protein-like isoform X2 [Dreissena polymorpha]